MSESISLFDGETLNGWGITGNPESWEVEDGCIQCKALKGKYLYTERNDFKDFELSLSFKHDPGANSGVFFRWTDLENPVQTGIEIQILDTHGKEPATKHCSGALYDCLAPIKNTCKPAGEWNTMTLTADGSNVIVAMNEELTMEADLSQWTVAGRNPDGSQNKFGRPFNEMMEAGYIGLQDHGGNVWFKDLILELP
ncbi:MAG: DUF1080 domain-containing protein [Candidatus Latescibacterota bacterium]|mgnify:FL=1|nr:DUF1080 domain-containing protein [Candidatus Latescibacterota bacterium]